VKCYVPVHAAFDHAHHTDSEYLVPGTIFRTRKYCTWYISDGRMTLEINVDEKIFSKNDTSTCTCNYIILLDTLKVYVLHYLLNFLGLQTIMS
jgi:hypothetical protein